MKLNSKQEESKEYSGKNSNVKVSHIEEEKEIMSQDAKTVSQNSLNEVKEMFSNDLKETIKSSQFILSIEDQCKIIEEAVEKEDIPTIKALNSFNSIKLQIIAYK